MSLSLTRVFTSPGPHPNGLQATTEGLWILDQENNKVSCHAYQDGTLLKMFDTDSDRGSGITDSGTHIWLSSTYSCETLKINRSTGETIKRHATPGAKKTGSQEPQTLKVQIEELERKLKQAPVATALK